MKLKTGIFTLPDDKMNFFEAVDYAAEIGADAIEPYPRAEFIVPDADAAKKLRSYAEAKNISICCFSMSADLSAEDNRIEIRRLKQYADVAAALGSPYLHHTLAPSLNPNRQRIPFTELLRRIVGGVREVYDYAKQIGVKCLYEDQGYQINGCARFEAFLNEVGREIGIVADLGNILFVGETPENFVGHFLPYIEHVHVKDYIVRDGSRDYPGEEWYKTISGDYLRGTIAGHGDVNLGKVIDILRSVDYNGFFSFEFDGLEDSRLAHKLSMRNLQRYLDISDAKSPRNASGDIILNRQVSV